MWLLEVCRQSWVQVSTIWHIINKFRLQEFDMKVIWSKCWIVAYIIERDPSILYSESDNKPRHKPKSVLVLWVKG